MYLPFTTFIALVDIREIVLFHHIKRLLVLVSNQIDHTIACLEKRANILEDSAFIVYITSFSLFNDYIALCSE